MLSVIILLVLMGLCAIVGSIWAYIYYTRINPRTNRKRKYMEQMATDDDGEQKKSGATHIFMFRKS